MNRRAALAFIILCVAVCASGNAEGRSGRAPLPGGAAAPLPALAEFRIPFPHEVLAEFVPPAPPGTGAWLQTALYVAAVLFFLIGGIEKAKRAFGRTPPIDDDLRALDRRLNDKIDKAVAALRDELVTCEAMDCKLAALVTSNELDSTERALRDEGESRRLLIEGKITKLDDDLSRKLGTVHARCDSTAVQIASMRAVLDLVAAHLRVKLGDSAR